MKIINRYSGYATSLARRYWRLLALVCFALLLAVTGLLLWQGGQRTDATWQRIQQTGLWRVGMDPSFPPFETLESNGQPTGFDVDLARAIAASWNITVTFHGIGFDGLWDAVIAQQVDAAISALPVEPRFARDVAYSAPYFEAGLVLVLSTDDSAIRRPEDLTGKRLAVERGSEGDARGRVLGRELAGLTLLPFQSPDEAAGAVVTKKADAALLDGVSAWLFAGHNPAVRVLAKAVVPDPTVIVLPIRSPGLLQAVNRALAELAADGTLAALRRQWFGPCAE